MSFDLSIISQPERFAYRLNSDYMALFCMLFGSPYERIFLWRKYRYTLVWLADNGRIWWNIWSIMPSNPDKSLLYLKEISHKIFINRENIFRNIWGERYLKDSRSWRSKYRVRRMAGGSGHSRSQGDWMKSSAKLWEKWRDIREYIDNYISYIRNVSCFPCM